MKDLEIRRFNIKDASEVVNILRRNFLEVNIKDYPKDEMENLTNNYNKEKILNIASNGHMYVALFEDKVVGCGCISSYYNKIDESILLTIFVLPEFHGKGIGKKVIITLENDAYFKRARRVEIPASITACEFYKKMGYTYKNNNNELDGEGHYRLEKHK